MLKPVSWYLSEVFAYYSKDKVYNPNIEESGYLADPMFITPNDYKKWNSDIIHQIPGYVCLRIDELRYCYGLPGSYRLTKVGDKDTIYISDEEAEKYSKVIFCDTAKKIEEALRQKGLIK